MHDAMFDPGAPHVLVNGWPAPHTPWVVQLISYGMSTTATGIVVNQDWVLTARHFVNQRRDLGHMDAMTTNDDSNDLNPHNLIEFDDLALGDGDVVALHVRRRSRRVLAGRAAPIDWDYNPATHIGDATVTYGFGGDTGGNVGTELRQATGQIAALARAHGATVITDRMIAGTTERGDSGGPVGVRIPPVNQNDTGFRVVGVHQATLMTRNRRMVWAPLHEEQRLRQIVTNRPTQVSVVENANSTVCTFTPSSSNA